MAKVQGHPGTVLVLGAGIAGLGAARALRAAGVDVTVIEARDRIGGRTYTSLLWSDLPADMGAAWVHGTKGNPLTVLADKTGVALTKTSYKRSMAIDQAGQRVDLLPMVKQAQSIVQAARARSEDLENDVSLRQAVESHPDWQALSSDARHGLRLAINSRIEHEYSGDWDRLSAWHYDDGKDFPGPEAILTPGYGPIMGHLSRGLDLRLSEPVTDIAPTGTGVQITTTRSIHRADRAVVTVPLGVLQSGSIRFAEPLKRKRQRAIDSLGMGLLNKCVLRFDRVLLARGYGLDSLPWCCRNPLGRLDKLSDSDWPATSGRLQRRVHGGRDRTSGRPRHHRLGDGGTSGDVRHVHPGTAGQSDQSLATRSLCPRVLFLPVGWHQLA